MPNKIKPEQVPEASLEAARKLIREEGDVWMSKLIAAALSAWPGAFLYPLNKTRLILPLPTQENGDE